MIGAVIFALFIHFRGRLWDSKLVKGDYGIAVTYWLFALLGSIVVAGLAYLYIAYKVGAMESADSDNGIIALFAIMGAFSAPGTAAVVVFLYQALAIVSVWRATSKPQVSFYKRWITRYGICLNAFVAALVFSLTIVSLVLGAALYFAIWHFYLKGRAGVGVERTTLNSPADTAISSRREGIENSGSIEIALADFSEDEPMLENYMQCIKPMGGLERRFHIWPEIPAEKLKAAIGSRRFKAGLTEHKPLLLVDDSRDYTGRDGLFVTDQFFDFKPVKGDGSSYAYKHGFDGFESKGSSILRMGEKCIEFKYFNEQVVNKFVLLVNSFFSDHRAWCEKMAAAGDCEAQFKLSSYIRDEAESIHWLRKAAKQGHIIAQSNLGVHLASSDLEASYRWLSLAASQGNELSARRLSSEKYNQFR